MDRKHCQALAGFSAMQQGCWGCWAVDQGSRQEAEGCWVGDQGSRAEAGEAGGCWTADQGTTLIILQHS